ncbi:lysozyme inhibitor LprI family protein [Psychrobacter sp. B38]|uniref:lysozyme inhibitor LprI family protein n=1 Tax=Psychrobacter sp. B38 TaxID=3143538 RepID=UPI00320C9CB4
MMRVFPCNEWTLDGSSVIFKENSTYLSLTSQAALIDSKYAASDKALDKSYQVTRNEVTRLYGEHMETDLKQEQIQWIKQRSKDCGADAQHQPRTQAEKVCFIQKNDSRQPDYFLWID